MQQKKEKSKVLQAKAFTTTVKTGQRGRCGCAGGGWKRLWSPPTELQTGLFFSFKSKRNFKNTRNNQVPHAGLHFL